MDNHSNISRGPTDLRWRVVQEAPFADVPAEVRCLIRRKQRAQDVEKLDGIISRCLASRVSLKHPNAGEWEISAALAGAPPLIRRSEVPDKALGTLARVVAVSVTSRPRPHASSCYPCGPRTSPLSRCVFLSLMIKETPDPQVRLHARLRLAEFGLQQALYASEDARQRGAGEHELSGLENMYCAEVNAGDVARQALREQ